MKRFLMISMLFLTTVIGAWKLIYVEDSQVATPLRWLERVFDTRLETGELIPVMVCEDTREFSKLTNLPNWAAGAVVNGVVVLQNRNFLELRGIWKRVLTHELLHYKLRRLNLSPCVEEGMVLLCEELFLGVPSKLRASSWYNFTKYDLWRKECLKKARVLLGEGMDYIHKTCGDP
ncbi:MAG: hypothetical protein DRP27_01610 [Thermotogae bacterium]|nr:MAG: hypothetical protein DRP27_01610 [Thermotogota bacterium]